MRVQRICLVNTPTRSSRPLSRSMMGGLGFGTDERMILPPLDLMVMAAVAREAGRHVLILDADAKRLEPGPAAAIVKEFGANAVVATVSLPTLRFDCDWIRSLSALSARPVYLKTFVRTPEILEEMLNQSGAPLVMIGEPDFSLLSILEGQSAAGTARLNPSGGVVLEEYLPIESLDDLPFAARDLLPSRAYSYPLLGEGVTTLQTSRGCPYPCGYYCPYPMVEGKKWRPMSPRRVVQEIQEIERASIRKILFRDATFTLDRDRTLEICGQLTAVGARVEWWCETRADLLDPELLEKMSKAGCRGINVGVESGNEDMIQTIGKRGLTLEKLARARRAAAEKGIRIHFLMQVGLPGETRHTLMDTLDLLYDLRPDSMGLTYTTPYPGTDLHRDAVKKGWLTTRNWEEYDAHTAIMRTEELTTDELVTGRTMIERGYEIIRGGAAPDRWRPFYIEALRWSFGLDPEAAARWIRASSVDPLWKRALRPLWRTLPVSWRDRIRRSFGGLFRQRA